MLTFTKCLHFAVMYKHNHSIEGWCLDKILYTEQPDSHVCNPIKKKNNLHQELLYGWI